MDVYCAPPLPHWMFLMNSLEFLLLFLFFWLKKRNKFVKKEILAVLKLYKEIQWLASSI